MHPYLNPYYSVDSTFRESGLGAFETRGTRFGDNSFTGGVEINADFSPNLSISFNYDVETNDSFPEPQF